MDIIKILLEEPNPEKTWTVIIGDKTHNVKEIVINNNSRIEKNHIEVKSNNYVLHNGILTIN